MGKISVQSLGWQCECKNFKNENESVLNITLLRIVCRWSTWWWSRHVSARRYVLIVFSSRQRCHVQDWWMPRPGSVITQQLSIQRWRNLAFVCSGDQGVLYWHILLHITKKRLGVNDKQLDLLRRKFHPNVCLIGLRWPSIVYCKIIFCNESGKTLLSNTI